MKNSFSLFIAFAIVIAITSCSEQTIIDEQYLRSQQYTEFQNRAVHEAQQKIRKPLSLESFLQQFKNCAQLPIRPLPTHFNAQQVSKLSKAVLDSCSIETDFQHIKLLAKSYTPNHTLRWILLDHKTTYRNQELVVSVFRDDQLRSFKTVGVYKKNLSENVTSKIHVRSDDDGVRILTETIRNILYPIEQVNTIESRYEINKMGDISELQEF